MQTIFLYFLFSILVGISSNLLGQSHCYLVLLGSDEKGERVRVHSPFQTNSPDGNPLIWSITGLKTPEELFKSARVDLEIRPINSKEFKKVKLQIPKPYGCHLLLVRDLKLKPPHYFRTEWLSQEMMDEYFFRDYFNGFDTTLFTKKFHAIIALPTIEISYKGQPFTAELIRGVDPFNGQNLDLTMDIVPASNSGYDAKLKAVEISFIHPDLTNIESKYILSGSTSKWPQNDSRFYWPNDFTMVSGAKITFKFLYWYKNGYEIKESGMVTRTIEF